MSMNNEQGEAQNSAPANAVEDLVGEGKKFKDVQALAHGKLEADRYIEELKAKLTSAEERLSQQDYVEEILGKLDAQMQKPKVQGPAEETPANSPTPNIEEILEKKLAERDTKTTQAANQARVRDALKAQLGDNYQAIAVQRGGALGLSESDMDALAANQPEVLLKALEVSKQAAPNQPGGISSEAAVRQTTQHKGRVYYSEMRRTMPSKFYSEETQAELMAARAALGDRFNSM